MALIALFTLWGVSATYAGDIQFRALSTTYVTLTVLDSVTTTVALHRGLVEKNPILGPIASNPPLLFATKTASALGTIWLANVLRKSHPRACTTVMIAINVATGVVVASNMRQLRR